MAAPVRDGAALFDVDAYTIKLTQAQAFVAPPMSVLDAAQGYWQSRKQQWLAEYPEVYGPLGREDIIANPIRAGGCDAFTQRVLECGSLTSIFDPVLAEVAYRWWTAPGAMIVDPFAGGPVRGIVASALGRRYVGADLRPEQVEANMMSDAPGARWVCADAVTWAPDVAADFVFSCPPYGSLEVYSDDPRDVSTMRWPDFRAAYKAAVANAVAVLRDDRFACFIVGNYKENGALRDLVGLTIDAFGEAGAAYYADLVLVTPVGSAAIRSAFGFPRSRRPMPRHQMALVFVKGNARVAARYVLGTDTHSSPSSSPTR